MFYQYFLEYYVNLLFFFYLFREVIELNEKKERKICLIINTSEYCNNLCKQLASTIKTTIDSEFKDKIDMKKEQQEFSG